VESKNQKIKGIIFELIMIDSDAKLIKGLLIAPREVACVMLYWKTIKNFHLILYPSLAPLPMVKKTTATGDCYSKSSKL
jgi:hypothetical protein